MISKDKLFQVYDSMTCGLQESRGAPEKHGSQKQGMWELDWKAEELGVIMKRNDELHS